jgi:hypothetical protein
MSPSSRDTPPCPPRVHGQSTFHAIDLSWCAVLLSAVATILEVPRQDGTKNEGRPLTIDGWKSLLDPAPNGIFVDLQESRNLLHRGIPVQFDQPIVRMPVHLEATHHWVLPRPPAALSSGLSLERGGI